MPPAALTCSTAVPTPSWIMVPYCVSGPLAGITRPILICACTAVARTVAVTAIAIVRTFIWSFMWTFVGVWMSCAAIIAASEAGKRTGLPGFGKGGKPDRVAGLWQGGET